MSTSKVSESFPHLPRNLAIVSGLAAVATAVAVAVLAKSLSRPLFIGLVSASAFTGTLALVMLVVACRQKKPPKEEPPAEPAKRYDPSGVEVAAPDFDHAQWRQTFLIPKWERFAKILEGLMTAANVDKTEVNNSLNRLLVTLSSERIAGKQDKATSELLEFLPKTLQEADEKLKNNFILRAAARVATPNELFSRTEQQIDAFAKSHASLPMEAIDELREIARLLTPVIHASLRDTKLQEAIRAILNQ